MDFARNQLMKYGWKEGKGLGRNESGITKALKPKLKFDTRGVGHDVSEQFTYHWWEHAFNKAANNIQVSTTEDGVAVKLQDESIDITTTKYSMQAVKKKKKNLLEYGTFLKTSTLTPEGQMVRMTTDTLEIPEQNDPLASFQSLTDDTLFRVCGGRTAHKGARHGLKLNGKLARIEEQERQLLANTKEYNKNTQTQNRTYLAGTDDISFSQDESVCVQKKFQQLDETEMEIKKKKKKSKRRHHKDTAGKFLLQGELRQTDVNAIPNETVAQSKKVDSLSTTTVGTQNFAATNEACTLIDESAMLKRKRKTKKSRSETENCELLCKGLQNMKQYQNIASETSAKQRKKNKCKDISSEATTHTEDTLMMNTAHKECHGSYSKKNKKKKIKALEAENIA